MTYEIEEISKQNLVNGDLETVACALIGSAVNSALEENRMIDRVTIEVNFGDKTNDKDGIHAVIPAGE